MLVVSLKSFFATFESSIVRGGWSVSFSLEQAYSFKVASKTFKEEERFIRFPIPSAGFKLPNKLAKVLNWVLPSDFEVKPEAGFFIVRPVCGGGMGYLFFAASHSASFCHRSSLLPLRPLSSLSLNTV